MISHREEVGNVPVLRQPGNVLHEAIVPTLRLGADHHRVAALEYETYRIWRILQALDGVQHRVHHEPMLVLRLIAGHSRRPGVTVCDKRKTDRKSTRLNPVTF